MYTGSQFSTAWAITDCGDKDSHIYFVVISPSEKLEYEAAVIAVGFSSKKGIGGQISRNRFNQDVWVMTLEGLKRWHETRRALRKGLPTKRYYEVNPDGSMRDLGR